MIGVLINVGTVIIGSLLGVLLKKGIPEKVANAVMTAVGLCVIYIGVSGALKGQNALVLILSMAFGTALGSIVDIDGALERFALFVEKKFQPKDGRTLSLAQGFTTASLLFCVGAMSILGSFDAGLKGDYQILITKSILDFFSAFMLATTLGIGVIFSAVVIFVYQGALTLGAGLLQNVLTDTALIGEITCAGSLMILAIGLNMLGITKIKVANLLPAILFVPLFYWLIGFLPI
ncbi:MAG: DUF554 domain-containing protein [Clostridia bacterium]|nr:DUF554 domain-containing protein [Clostridia bacterium]